ncbi:hypothetical protein [Bradyrhizobium sp. USDA 376]
MESDSEIQRRDSGEVGSIEVDLARDQQRWREALKADCPERLAWPRAGGKLQDAAQEPHDRAFDPFERFAVPHRSSREGLVVDAKMFVSQDGLGENERVAQCLDIGRSNPVPRFPPPPYLGDLGSAVLQRVVHRRPGDKPHSGILRDARRGGTAEISVEDLRRGQPHMCHLVAHGALPPTKGDRAGAFGFPDLFQEGVRRDY